MPENIDSQTLIRKLNAVPELAKRHGKLIASLEAEQAARSDLAAHEAAVAAAAEKKRLAEAGRLIGWSPVPQAPTDLALVGIDRHPFVESFVSVEVEYDEEEDGVAIKRVRSTRPARPSLGIGFLPKEMAKTFSGMGWSGPGWFVADVRRTVFLLDSLRLEQAETVVGHLRNVALLRAMYGVYGTSAVPTERMFADRIASELLSLGYNVRSSHVPDGLRAEREQDERLANEIWQMANSLSGPPTTEARTVDSEAEQHANNNAQLLAQLQRQSDKANREAAKLAASEAQ